VVPAGHDDHRALRRVDEVRGNAPEDGAEHTSAAMRPAEEEVEPRTCLDEAPGGISVQLQDVDRNGLGQPHGSRVGVDVWTDGDDPHRSACPDGEVQRGL
jgi:hypothetical protein